MQIDLTGKIALVTGASRGIGKAIALALAHAGARVVGTATTDEGAKKITASLASVNSDSFGLALDVRATESIDALAQAMKDGVGMPEIVVNNAGITRDNLFMRMKPDEWNDVIATNLSAVFHLSKAFIRPMVKARWGRFINISSVVGETGNPGQANYCAAKAGLIGLSKSLAHEYASRNVTVNVVAPGFIETDMTGDLTEAQQTQILQGVPLARMGKSEEIANMVAFLASPLADYITGQTLHINGGMFMK